MANLFTSQTPSSTNNSDGTPTIVTATTLVFAVSGAVTGVRYYATDNTDGSWTGYLWQPTASDSSPAGTQLASKAGPTPSAGWNTITFDTPVSVSAGVAYRVGIHSSDGRYVFTGSFFTGALVNGDITGIANGATVGGLVLANGTFRIDSSAGYPSSGGGSCYFVDVDFTADEEAVTGSGALTLPAVTASGTGTASATGTSALTLPALTASGAGAASASGSGTPSLLALTAAGAGTASATGSGSLTMPALTASGAGGEPGAETFGARPVVSVSTRRPELTVYARPPTLN